MLKRLQNEHLSSSNNKTSNIKLYDIVNFETLHIIIDIPATFSHYALRPIAFGLNIICVLCIVS